MDHARKLNVVDVAPAAGDEAASIGVQSIDPVLSHSLATRASVAINRFTQKHKL